jgi:hypothetical protein
MFNDLSIVQLLEYYNIVEKILTGDNYFGLKTFKEKYNIYESSIGLTTTKKLIRNKRINEILQSK